MTTDRDRNKPLTRGDWVELARQTLITSGIAAVKIEPLAQSIGATRGSFYWHFEDHADLLRAVLHHWVTKTGQPFDEAIANAATNPLEAMARFNLVWLQKHFDAAYDSALRDWGRINAEVADAVRTFDEARIAQLQDLFSRLGYEPVEGLVRARTFYYHQIGYHALKVTQDRDERAKLFPVYFRVLSGFPLPPSVVVDF